MYAEGETELRDLIVQNLESCGFLNKIKAELRAGVFLAFEEEGSLRTKIPLFSKKFDEFIETDNGKLMVSIVREFLEYFELNFTLSVFDPEIASTSPCMSRADLCSKMNISSTEFDGPVISAFMKPGLASETEKQKIFPLHSENHSVTTTTTVANPSKILETIAEDFPVKEKNGYENIELKNTVASSLTSFSLNSSAKEKTNEDFTLNATDSTRLPSSGMIEKLRNDKDLELVKNEKSKISDIFNKDKDEISDTFKSKGSSSTLDHDPFFDEPVPSEKPSYFNLPDDSGFDSQGLKDLSQNKSNANSLLNSDKSVLSSLKDLPSLTSTRSKDWTFSKDLPKSLPSLDPVKNAPNLKKSEDEEVKDNPLKDLDPESNEDSSERQLNSDESIEEDIEEDLSAVDDLLNSSLSLGDDATSDQTVSQVSVVDGVDHVEGVIN